MKFSFSPEQLELRDATARMLHVRCTPDTIRATWTSDHAESYQSLWVSLIDMGLLGSMAPQRVGGLGLDMVDVIGVIEQMGHSGLPGPAPEHAFIAVPLLNRATNISDELLTRVASGTSRCTAALTSQGAVPWTSIADIAFVGRGQQVICVSTKGSARVMSVDRAWKGGLIDQLLPDVLALEGVTSSDLADLGAITSAAQLIGAAQAMLDMTVKYVESRHQFGKPVGSFQAVKHHLANVATEIEFCRPLVYRAAWSIRDLDPDASLHASMAKYSANETAKLAAKIAHQCHGALGHTEEYDLNLWMKRSWVLASSFGSSQSHLDKIERLVVRAE